MNIIKSFDRAFSLKSARNWDRIYVLIDIHDTIFKASYNAEETYEWFPYAKEALQAMSRRKDICIILWTSTYKNHIINYIETLKNNDINIDFVNENPLEKNSILSDFSHKFYFNVGLDDKFGFEPENDWVDVLKFFTYNVINYDW